MIRSKMHSAVGSRLRFDEIWLKSPLAPPLPRPCSRALLPEPRRLCPTQCPRLRRQETCSQWLATGPGTWRLGPLSPSSARYAVTAYAYARTGYHRGLDALRAAGWRGSGYVRWRNPSNRGFLRCVEALRRRAGEIGEEDEEQRCALFLRQLDPDWDRRGG